MHKHAPTILAICGLVLIAALWLYEEPSNSQTEEGSSNVVTIVSTPLPTLPTHDHSQGDAVEDDAHGVYVTSPIYTTPRDMWISEIQPIATGAPFAVVHHLMLQLVDVKDQLCGNIRQNIVVVGMDNNKRIAFPEPFGYFIQKGTRIQLLGMLHNPEKPLGSGESYTNVSAGFELVEAKLPDRRVRPVEFYMVAAEDPPHCTNNFTFTVPPNTTKYIKSSDTVPGDNSSFVTFSESGTIVTLASHTHGWQGGRDLAVHINGLLYKTFNTEQISDSPQVWSSVMSEDFLPIAAGDTITIQAEYTNPDPLPIRGAMGIIGFYFAKDSPQ